MKAGLHLDDAGTRRLPWCDLRAFVKDTRPGSALAVSYLGEEARWGDAEHLLAIIADALRGANWQRSGRDYGQPEPLPRPGTIQHGAPRTIAGDDPVTVDEFDRWLAAKQHS